MDAAGARRAGRRCHPPPVIGAKDEAEIGESGPKPGWIRGGRQNAYRASKRRLDMSSRRSRASQDATPKHKITSSSSLSFSLSS
jgi:hypothetical protein